MTLEMSPAAFVGEPADTLTGAPTETNALISHILTRYHETHRREIAELIPLAVTVEHIHAGRADAPKGLARTLKEMEFGMISHMHKEETILFPLMREGGHPMIGAPIHRMREEHDAHAANLLKLKQITHGFQLPDDACSKWQALYAGVKKLAEDLVAHMYLENEVLFPRFASADDFMACGGGCTACSGG